MKTGPVVPFASLVPFAMPALASCVLLVAGCARLTEPPSASSTSAPKPAETAAAQPAPTPPPTPAPTPPAETAGAAHILVAYEGAMRADPTLKRTKAEAQKRAADILSRAKKGDDFGKLADDMSDDPSAKRNHGDLGQFTREQMVKLFSDAAFALKPGEISALVETPFGFHIIKRTR